MKKVLSISLKVFCTIILSALALLAVFSISPIYNFADTAAFSGPDIFNPYAGVDSNQVWKRANFHTHTKVKGPLNECPYWPETVYEDYKKLGYDILTFSNHNKLTEHPCNPELQVNVYEHGYGLAKYHKLVFGAEKVNHFDHLFPILASQRQWQMDYLGKNADFIQLNHPYRTPGSTEKIMEKLTGYRIIELDSGVGTEQEYWDWALSTGHYSFALANDDNHNSKASARTAVRANFLDTESGKYEDLKEALLSGAYYCMRIPDYGDGDWEIKYAENADLPEIDEIGLRQDTLFVTLSEPADSIVVTGQGHTTLTSDDFTDRIEYVIKENDPYARVTAYFNDGAVIYTNAFARYDSSISRTPYIEVEHTVNIPLTVLFNLFLAVVAAACIYAEIRLLSRKKKD